MSEMTLEEFDKLKNLLGIKYAQWKALEKEVKFLQSKFRTILQFRDENEWKGKTDHATFNLKEGFRISYPGNGDLEKKGEFYRYMQQKDKPWFQQSITLNWNAVNAYCNTEMDAAAQVGKDWDTWPHCSVSEEFKFDMRVRPGVGTTLYDPAVVAMGFEG